MGTRKMVTNSISNQLKQKKKKGGKFKETMDNQIATGQGRSWARGQDAAGSLRFPHPSPFFSFPFSVSVSSASFPTQIASTHFVENKTNLNSQVPTRGAVTVSPCSNFKKITAEKELVGQVWVRSSCLLNQ